MIPVINKLLPFVSIFVVVTSCKNQSLSGQWKLRQVDLIDVPNQKSRFTIDFTQPEQMRAYLYKANLPEINMERDTSSDLNNEAIDMDTTMDVDAMRADIDQYVASSLDANMKLGDDHQFYMKSNGWIVPTAVPGWHFGDSIQGSWATIQDTLIFSIGDNSQDYKWKFKILQVTDKDLRLQEVFDGFEGRGNELRFVRL